MIFDTPKLAKLALCATLFCAAAATPATAEMRMLPGEVSKFELPRFDEKTGAKIIQNILDAPLRQIAENSGEDSGVIVAKVLEQASENIGFNAASGTFVNMIESGIIDPTKVTRSTIENAGSVASSILTTDVIVAELPQNPANQTMN